VIRVYLKNIGGLVGEHSFELREGVNEVMAPNASGKTTFIKALLALLNPRDPNVVPESLLNRDADEGYIRVEIDGEEFYRVFRREGGRVIEVSSKPIANDERFSWFLLDPFMGRLVSRVLAGEEDITDFIDLTFELNKLRERIEVLRRREEELRIKREDLLEKSKDLARLLKEREDVERKLAEKEKEAEKVEAEKVRIKEEIEKNVRELREKIGTLRGRLDSYKKELEETIERIKDAENRIKALEEMLDEFHRKHPNIEAELRSIDEEIDDIRKAIKMHEERLSDLNRANPVIADAVSHSLPYCPVCGRSIEEPEKFWSRRASDLDKAVKELMEAIDELRRKETELLNTKGRLESERTKILNIKDVELPALRRRLETEKDKKARLEDSIRDIEAQITVLEERVKELEATMPEEERRRIESLGTIAAEAKALREYLEGINRRIAALGDVGEQLEAIEKELASTIREREETERRLHQLRREVAVEFRRIANELVKALGFAWFKSISLDEINGRYFIRVVRVFPSGREDKQNLRELSTSERISIAIIAVLTGFKLGLIAYPQDKTLILADEALVAFDPDRYEKVVEELRKYSKYVVVTRLVEPEKTPVLRIAYR